MKKLLLLLFLFLLSGSFAFAEATGPMCPISGEKASGKFTETYNGQKYSFCCPKCVKEFRKNPEKYLSLTAAQTVEHAHAH